MMDCRSVSELGNCGLLPRLAWRYGVSENGVLDQLKRMGVQLRPRGKVTANQGAEMPQLRDPGW